MDKGKVVVNIYGILDNELTRMHALLQTYMTLPKNDDYNSRYGGGGLSSSSSFSSHNTGIPMIYQRIMEIQDLMLKALVAHDEVIQAKIAELALTGDKDETIPTR
jgi:hypothetical protein